MNSHRTFRASQIIVMFARHGVAISKIAACLVTPINVVERVCARAVERGDMLKMPPLNTDDARGALATEVVHLRDEVDGLRRTLAEVKGNAETDRFAYCTIAGGMTANESQMVAALVEHGRVSRERFYLMLYGDRPGYPGDTPDPKIVDVFLCKIRKKLRKIGVTIGTVWGWGYELTPDNAAKVRTAAGWPSTVREAA